LEIKDFIASMDQEKLNLLII
jgi:hypothetical protein